MADESNSGKTNINTVAKLAQVSTTTVSNYLNGTEKFPLSMGTRVRIRQVMRELHYRPNVGGSLLWRKREIPGKVCFCFGSDPKRSPFRVIQTPHLSELLRLLEPALRERLNLRLEVRSISRERDRAEWNDLLLDVDYLINYGNVNLIMADLADRKNIPLLELSNYEEIRFLGRPENPVFYDHVYWDTRSQIDLLLPYFKQQGARRIVFIASWNIKCNRGGFCSIDAEARYNAFLKAAAADQELTCDVIVPPIPAQYDEFFLANPLYDLLLTQYPKWLQTTDAFIASDDISASAAIAALRAVGRVPGRDVLVGGQGNYPSYRYLHPTFPTVCVDRKKQIDTICDTIDFRKKNPDAPAVKHRIACQLLHAKQPRLPIITS